MTPSTQLRRSRSNTGRSRRRKAIGDSEPSFAGALVCSLQPPTTNLTYLGVDNLCQRNPTRQPGSRYD
jgi:hypothetical protein